MSDNPFDGLEDAFDAPHAHELEDFDDKKPPVVFKRDVKLVASEEAHESYLIENMINSIETARYAVERMETEIKQGTDARTYEVYGQLIDTLNRQVSSCLQVHKLRPKRIVAQHFDVLYAGVWTRVATDHGAKLSVDNLNRRDVVVHYL